ncbi:MAG TPA: hypothetical protein VLX68_09995 [Chitinivibrionales bacterium]|nr:hypothetical protein [Chitinivibrionales bacterium]
MTVALSIQRETVAVKTMKNRMMFRARGDRRPSQSAVLPGRRRAAA